MTGPSSELLQRPRSHRVLPDGGERRRLPSAKSQSERECQSDRAETTAWTSLVLLVSD